MLGERRLVEGDRTFHHRPHGGEIPAYDSHHRAAVFDDFFGIDFGYGGTEAKTDVMPFAVYLDWNGGMMGWVVTFSLVCIFLAIASMGAVRIIGGKSYVW